jgi:hypothetical protein
MSDMVCQCCRPAALVDVRESWNTGTTHLASEPAVQVSHVIVMAALTSVHFGLDCV